MRAAEARPPLERLLRPLWLVVAFLMACTPMQTFDIWWHLRAGQWIREHGRVPHVDLFTYADAGRAWIDLHWGFQVLVSALYDFGGPAGAILLVLAKAACVAAMLALGLAASGRTLPLGMRVCLWLLPMLALLGRTPVRPETVTLVMLALWLWLLPRISERPHWMWGLPLLQVVWLNLHGLFILGLVVWGCYGADQLARRRWGGRFGLAQLEAPTPLGTLWGVSALLVLAAVVSPYGIEGALFPFVLYKKLSVDVGFYGKHVMEFASPLLYMQRYGFNPYVAAGVAIWLLTAASFVALGMRRRVSVLHLLLFIGFTQLASSAQRNVGLFALVAATVLAANVEQLWGLRVGGSSQAVASKQTRHRWAAAACLVVALMGGAFFTGALVPLLRDSELRFHPASKPNWYAHDAIRFAGAPGMPERAFASHIGLAAVYTFHHGPQRKVFTDGRLEVGTRATLERSLSVENAWKAAAPKVGSEPPLPDGSWAELIRDEHGELPVVIVDTSFGKRRLQGMMRQPDWRLVFADGGAAVFLHAAAAQRLHLPDLRTGNR